MGLVDYSSSDSEPSASPPAKKRRTSPESSFPQPQSTPTDLPPLPSTFHDLYAHTVRQSPSDDPSLHQGRRRVIPHVPGNWPSHIYVEWIPTAPQHALLSSFLSRLQAALLPDVQLNGFLTSDLGAPLPLHVSLSRPFVLGTAEKDAFLEKLVEQLGSTEIGSFNLGCWGGLEWHRTPESGRSFLVLRVRSRRGRGDESAGESDGVADEGCDRDEDEDEDNDGQVELNPELVLLLTRCNTRVASYGQPSLYDWADGARLGDAFHVSIAWSFAEPDEELRRKTAIVFSQPEFRKAISEMEFQVGGVKAKIGNVVNHIPLYRNSKRARGMLGA
jgi:hypothetical protein